jgi:predicted CDP-diglyceride synthetase/phosphatidate cytidylyltransferase
MKFVKIIQILFLNDENRFLVVKFFQFVQFHYEFVLQEFLNVHLIHYQIENQFDVLYLLINVVYVLILLDYYLIHQDVLINI